MNMTPKLAAALDALRLADAETEAATYPGHARTKAERMAAHRFRAACQHRCDAVERLCEILRKPAPAVTPEMLKADRARRRAAGERVSYYTGGQPKPKTARAKARARQRRSYAEEIDNTFTPEGLKRRQEAAAVEVRKGVDEYIDFISELGPRGTQGVTP